MVLPAECRVRAFFTRLDAEDGGRRKAYQCARCQRWHRDFSHVKDQAPPKGPRSMSQGHEPLTFNPFAKLREMAPKR